MNAKTHALIDLISKLRNDEIKSMIEDLCERTSISKFMLDYELTYGWDYIIEDLVSEIYLSNKPIDRYIRITFILIHTGLDVNIGFNHLFVENEKLAKMDKKDWHYEDHVRLVDELRKLFVTAAYKIIK
jgi:hypothetical protein